MRKLIVAAAVVGMTLMQAGAVYASPANENKGNNNPNVVAFYPDSTHTVIQPDGSIKYEQPGADLVMQAGKNFQQWYDGPSTDVHTLWRNVGDDTSCNGHFTLVENPYQPPTGDTWGTYFPNGDNYCVKSNSQH